MSTTPPTDPQATRATLEALLPGFQEALRNFLFGLLHNRQTAEDALQESLLKALVALEKGTGRLPSAEPQAIKHWLARIARNTAIDMIRHRDLITWIPMSRFVEDRGIGVGAPLQGGTSAQPTEESFGAHLAVCFSTNYNGGTFEDAVALDDLIERALEQLPVDYACCLRLFAFDDYSCLEIAKQLHLSHDAVKARLYRARKMLAKFYHAN